MSGQVTVGERKDRVTEIADQSKDNTATLGGQGLADRIRQAYAALGEGDLEPMRRLYAEDCTWYIVGNNPASGEHRGLERVPGTGRTNGRGHRRHFSD
jgi:SnoaL-like domain